ncbi:hypothetical protein [Microbacterium mangrovi]|uniref:hypothetical protein n=1 Tax=Microbacterium mangrovi TaxID=1348253 RepID=UPI0012E00EC5|nr:hypothetical protein [Microbacterium mangrovi]
MSTTQRTETVLAVEDAPPSVSDADAESAAPAQPQFGSVLAAHCAQLAALCR